MSSGPQAATDWILETQGRPTSNSSRQAGMVAASQAPSPASDLLTPLLLRTLALASPDPTSLLLAYSDHSALDDTFQLQWFLRWHGTLLPHRPWQYAVLTWRRMQGQPARVVVDFMLLVAQALADAAQQRRQQEQQQQQDSTTGAPSSSAATAAAAAQQQPEQPRPWSICYYREAFEGQFVLQQGASGFADSLRPLPSTLRRVRRLLAQQTPQADLQALVALCPCASVLLGQYAARCSVRGSTQGSGVGSPSSSQVAPLLQQLLELPWVDPNVRGVHASLETVTGGTFVRSSVFGRYVQNQSLMQLGALASGLPDHLLVLLLARTPQVGFFYGGRIEMAQGPRLLRYAVRYSNAACLEAVCHTIVARGNAHLAPQHLAMAAGRADPWAADVVRLLMRLLPRQQLKPASMRPAYEAAFRVQHMPVLRLLLAHAAAAAPQQQHLPVLLVAAVTAGNLQAAQLLLGSSTEAAAAPGSSMQQQQEAGLPLPQDLVPPGLDAGAALRALSALQVLQLLDALLPQAVQRVTVVNAAASMLWAHDPAEEQARLAVADRVWQLLAQPSMESPALHRLQHVLRHTYLFMAPDGASASKTQQELSLARSIVHSEHPARHAWLQQHLQPYTPARTALLVRSALRGALRRGTSHAAGVGLQLQRLVLQQDRKLCCAQAHTLTLMQQLQAHAALGTNLPVDERSLVEAWRQYVAMCDQSTQMEALAVLEGRLVAACAACDAAAVAHLEALFQLCHVLAGPPAMAAGAAAAVSAGPSLLQPHIIPTLPVTLAGGSVVTPAHLAAWLGLPWQQLQHLLDVAKLPDQAAAGAAVSGQTAACGDSSSNGRESIRRADVTAAMAMVAAPAGYANTLLQPLLVSTGAPQSDGSSSSSTSHAPGADPQAAAGDGGAQPAGDAVHPGGPRAAHASQQEGSAAYALLLPRARRADEAAWEQHVIPAAHRLHAEQLLCEPTQPLVQQRGPLPLWQTALLQVLAQTAAAKADIDKAKAAAGGPSIRQELIRVGPVRLPGLEGVDGLPLLLSGLRAGAPVEAVQQLLTSRLLQPQRMLASLPLPAEAPWGLDIMREALVRRLPGLLAWSLEPARREVLYGTSHTAVESAALELCRLEGCSPITCHTLHPTIPETLDPGLSHTVPMAGQQRMQQHDMAQLQRQQEAGTAYSSCGAPMPAAAGGPVLLFVQVAVQLALLLLQQAVAAEDLLSSWLRYGLRADASLADLARARGIVAAVAESRVVPLGARVCEREAVRQVLLCGDADLWSASLLWCDRLQVVDRDPDDVEGGVLGAPGWEDEDEDGADPAVLAALLGGANI